MHGIRPCAATQDWWAVLEGVVHAHTVPGPQPLPRTGTSNATARTGTKYNFPAAAAPGSAPLARHRPCAPPLHRRPDRTLRARDRSDRCGVSPAAEGCGRARATDARPGMRTPGSRAPARSAVAPRARPRASRADAAREVGPASRPAPVSCRAVGARHDLRRPG